MTSSNKRSTFAQLRPANYAACLAFHHVAELVKSDPQIYRHHARYLKIADETTALAEVLNVVPHTAGASPTGSFSSEGTVPDEGNDPMASPVWSGWYEFSLDVPPEIPKLGWRVGYGQKWTQDPNGCIDILLIPRADAKEQRVHGYHALFNILADSGCFGIRTLPRDRSTRLGSRVLLYGQHLVPLREAHEMIAFGELQYEFQYTVAALSEKAHQQRKAQYMSDMLDMEKPIPHTLATPSNQDVRIGDWKLLKTAGAGAHSVIRSAISSSGELVAVRCLQGGPRVNHGDEIDRARSLDQAIATARHRDKVLRLREVILSSDPEVDSLYDVYLLLSPLARGDLATVVLQADGFVDRNVRLQLFSQAIAGLSALHAVCIVHADISARNVGVVSLHPPRAVILDLAPCQRLHGRFQHGIPTTPGSGGTAGYLAPERELCDSLFGYPVDVWALGCIGYDLFFGPRNWATQSNPWRDLRSLDAIDTHDRQENIRLFNESHRVLASKQIASLESLLARMLDIDHKERIPIALCLTHRAVRDDLQPTNEQQSSHKRQAPTL